MHQESQNLGTLCEGIRMGSGYRKMHIFTEVSITYPSKPPSGLDTKRVRFWLESFLDRGPDAIPAHVLRTPTQIQTSKMACIASSFTGSVAALKASKVQVSIAHEHDARRRSAEMPVCERLSFFAGRLLDTPSRGDASGGMYRATGPRESMRTSIVRSVSPVSARRIPRAPGADPFP